MPGADEPVAERLLFLQENMVNFVKQYSLPVVEVALVVSKYIRALKDSLEDAAEASGEVLPARLAEPWAVEIDGVAPVIDSFSLDRLLGSLDEDRMDIFDTIIRTIVNGSGCFGDWTVSLVSSRWRTSPQLSSRSNIHYFPCRDDSTAYLYRI